MFVHVSKFLIFILNGGSVIKNLPAMQETWVRKIPQGRKWPRIPVFLPGKSQEQKSLVGYSHGVAKESDMN